MKSTFKLLAATATAAVMAVSAQAATFDFSFYIERDGLQEVGSGELSFTGDAIVGSTNTLADLADFAFSFTIDGRTFDQDDPRLLNMTQPALDIFELNGEIVARFAAQRFIDVELTISEVELDQPITDKFCSIGAFAVVNDLNDCVSFEVGRPSRALSSDDTIAMGEFFLSPGIFDKEQFALGDLGRFQGRYLGVLADDDMAAVPLPASLPLLAFAIGGLGYMRKRRS